MQGISEECCVCGDEVTALLDQCHDVRHLDGKDLTTGYASRIDAVKASDVQAVLDLLESGSKVEYVIKGR